MWRVQDRGGRIEAAVSRGAAPLSVESLDLGPMRENEALVRIKACGICRTDVDLLGSGRAMVLGHEGAGVIEAVGAAVEGFAPGDPVALSYQSCGGCDACTRGRPTDCAHFWDLNFGFQRLDGSSAYEKAGVSGHFFGQSAFASHALPTARNMVRLDPDLPLELMAPLGCGFQTGAATVLIALGVKPGETVAVLGTGSVGLAAVMAARIAQADPIIAVDQRPQRLGLVRELGATHVIESGAQDVEARIRQIAGGLDAVVDSTGDGALDRIGRDLLAPGGRMARLTGGGAMDLPEGRKVLSVIQGDAIAQDFIPRMIGFWRDGRFPIERLIRVYDFAAINQAIEDIEEGRVIKPVLRMPEG